MLRNKILSFKNIVSSTSFHQLGDKLKLINKVSTILQKPSSSRKEEEIEFLVKSTETIKFFKDLTEQNGNVDVHKQCCQFMTHENHQIGDRVISIGEIGDKFYIILSGRVSIYIKTKFEEPVVQPQEEQNTSQPQKGEEVEQKQDEKDNLSKLKKVGEMKSGQSFGELALQSRKPRMATIVCEELSEFFILSKKDFDKILKNQKALNKQLSYLQELPFFSEISNDCARVIYSRAEYVQFVANQTVFSEGQDPNLVYIVRKGIFRGHKKFYAKQMTKNEMSQKRLDLLPVVQYNTFEKKGIYKSMKMFAIGQDQLFGEEEIMLDTKRMQTVVCESLTGELLVIQKNIFVQKVMQDAAGSKYLQMQMKFKQCIWETRVQQTQDLVDKNWNLLSEDRQRLKITNEIKHEGLNRQNWANSFSSKSISQEINLKANNSMHQSFNEQILRKQDLENNNSHEPYQQMRDKKILHSPMLTELQKKLTSKSNFLRSRSLSCQREEIVQNLSPPIFQLTEKISQNSPSQKNSHLKFYPIINAIKERKEEENDWKSNDSFQNIFVKQNSFTHLNVPFAFCNKKNHRNQFKVLNKDSSQPENSCKDPLKIISKRGELIIDPLQDEIQFPENYKPTTFVVQGDGIEQISQKKLALKNPYINYLLQLKKENPPKPIHLLKKSLAKKYIKHQKSNLGVEQSLLAETSTLPLPTQSSQIFSTLQPLLSSQPSLPSEQNLNQAQSGSNFTIQGISTKESLPQNNRTLQSSLQTHKSCASQIQEFDSPSVRASAQSQSEKFFEKSTKILSSFVDKKTGIGSFSALEEYPSSQSKGNQRRRIKKGLSLHQQQSTPSQILHCNSIHFGSQLESGTNDQNNSYNTHSIFSSGYSEIKKILPLYKNSQNLLLQGSEENIPYTKIPQINQDFSTTKRLNTTRSKQSFSKDNTSRLDTSSRQSTTNYFSDYSRGKNLMSHFTKNKSQLSQRCFSQESIDSKCETVPNKFTLDMGGNTTQSQNSGLINSNAQLNQRALSSRNPDNDKHHNPNPTNQQSNNSLIGVTLSSLNKQIDLLCGNFNNLNSDTLPSASQKPKSKQTGQPKKPDQRILKTRSTSSLTLHYSNSQYGNLSVQPLNQLQVNTNRQMSSTSLNNNPFLQGMKSINNK